MTVAHKRNRHILDLLIKKLRFSPIVSIQGPRQCGKSFLARELLPSRLGKSIYRTLDTKDVRTFAEESPGVFLLENQPIEDSLSKTLGHPLIIDEVQKVPDLFDEMKAIVDLKRKPGQFLILGSTEFSIEAKIKESLTGRLSRIRLYPFSMSEVKGLPRKSAVQFPFFTMKPRIQRSDLLKFFKNGGFPGIFSVKSELEQKALFDDWINLTVERDLHQLKSRRLDSGVARRLIYSIAKTGEATQSNLASDLGISAIKTKSHLDALKTLFVIFEVKPWKSSTGNSEYYLTDVGLINHLGGGFSKRLKTWFYLETLSHIASCGMPDQQLYFYRTAKGKFVECIYDNGNSVGAVRILDKESADNRDVEIFKNLKKKLKIDKEIRPMIFYGGKILRPLECGVTAQPWEMIV